MAGGLLGIAASGLLAAQRALATTGHNISNANTEGYSRQRVDLSERDPTLTSGGYIGNGVNIDSVSRSYDSFLNTQMRTSLSGSGAADAYAEMASRIDSTLGDKSSGLASPLQSFFDAAQAVADDPSAIAARQVMLTQADSLAQRFNTLNTQFDTLRSQAQQTLSSDVDEVNTLASGIASLNTQIVNATSIANGQPPNDLLDQRNLLLEKLSGKVDTSVLSQKDGSINVFIGNGQSLVMGSASNKLQVQASAYDGRVQDIAIQTGDQGSIVITQSLTGGEMGGLLKFGQEVLDPAQNSLGRIAAGLGLAVNAQHVQGTDLKGNPGGNFFTDPTTPLDSWFPKQGNTGDAQVSVAFDNTAATATTAANGPAQLTASDYRLDFDSAGQAVLTRLSDNTHFTDNPTGSGNFQADGLKIGIATGTAAAGDSFLIKPFSTAAGTLKPAINDPNQIAAAGPEPTGPGDNTNARALANLQTTKGLLDNKATFQGAYTQLVGESGVKSRAAKLDSTAQENLLNQVTQSRESVSGVNLDEEAANLVRFQQAYQASAQLIPALTSTFEALLSAVRG
jgi:flagellar hook-associated protein 1 FlgK